MSGMAGFLQGLAGGAVMGLKMKQSETQDKREQESHDLQKRDVEGRLKEREQKQQAWQDLAGLIDEYNPKPPASPQMGGISPAPPAVQPVEGAVASPAPLENTVAPMPASRGVRFAQPRSAEQPRQANASPVDVAVDQLVAKEGLSPEEAQQAKEQIGERMETERIGLGLWRNPNLFKDPKFLDRAGQIFLKAGMPDGVKWLERGAQAVGENSIDALKRLIGGDARGAEEAFNAGGRMKVIPGSTRDVGNGKWEVKFQDGKTQVFEPRQALRSYLKPTEFFNLELKEREVGSKEQQNKNTANRLDRDFKEKNRHNRATEGIQQQLVDVRTKFGAGADTAMVKNIEFMLDNDIAEDATDAYGKLRTALEKPEEDAILSVAGNLMKGPGYMGKKGFEKAVKDATKMVQTVKRGKPAPVSGAPGAAGGRTYSAGGKTFTDTDIEATAKKYGIPPEQVKARLGIR